jgi:hypothetical protein
MSTRSGFSEAETNGDLRQKKAPTKSAKTPTKVTVSTVSKGKAVKKQKLTCRYRLEGQPESDEAEIVPAPRENLVESQYFDLEDSKVEQAEPEAQPVAESKVRTRELQESKSFGCRVKPNVTPTVYAALSKEQKELVDLLKERYVYMTVRFANDVRHSVIAQERERLASRRNKQLKHVVSPHWCTPCQKKKGYVKPNLRLQYKGV